MQFTSNYVPVSSFINNYSAFPASPGNFSACVANSYTYTWSNGTSNQLKLLSFTANARTFVVAASPAVTVKLRRVNNVNVTGIRSILYSESTTSPTTTCPNPQQLDFKAPYNDNMESFLNNNVLNHGTDNLFTNAGNGDGNNNNIERVDVIFTTGISTPYPTQAGFVLCERGSNNAHDGFRIAAILSLNGSGDPASFGSLKTCVAGNGSNNGSWGHPSIANGNKQLAAFVLRKDPADTYLRVSSNVNQELGGVFFSLADLGVAANQVVYGYCLVGPDGIANPTSAQLLDINDATVYPTGTTEAQGGGLDLISINTFYGTTQALAKDGVRSFTGAIQNSRTVLNWELDTQPAGTTIYLERSMNNSSFNSLYSYIYDNRTPANTYTDMTGDYYYRLRIQSLAGAARFSQIIHIQPARANKWKIYPTIALPGESLKIEGMATGTYEATLHSLTTSLPAVRFQVQGGKGVIQLPRILPAGIYYLLIENRGERMGDACKIIIRTFY